MSRVTVSKIVPDRRMLIVSIVVLIAILALCFGDDRRRYSVYSSSPTTASEYALINSAEGPLGDSCLFSFLASSAGVDPVEESASNGALGGDVSPLRYVMDPYPTFNGIAVDPKNDVVAMSDTNRKSLLIYARTSESKSGEITKPLRQIIGPNTLLGFASGVTLDPVNRELYGVNNDIEDNMSVFSYDAAGDLKPKRALAVPHGVYDISLSLSRDEIAMSVHDSRNAIVIYRREAKGAEAPVRMIRGLNTGLADPHGIYMDDVNNEIFVANRGSWNMRSNTFYSGKAASELHPGRNEPPSISVHDLMAQGDAKPLRTIQGPKTRLNWPAGIEVDLENNELVVANNGGDSVLIFRRTDSGDVEPLRVIRGDRTGIDHPMGVAIDTKNNELWVANFGDHTAVVFDRTARGNATPRRIIRNAPAGTATCGMGNPLVVAYDSKREEILVPN